ncbi:MAG: chemotaxis protein CheR [Proteobacteria bacterium]|nr:chemotaxis protein CheR [Desulfobulbaceae bacterium]MBU4151765.1 chemotaxis protein CheR [Pseudomonadota bacterium]MDP2106776.1 CheR family methyltransferase [Desulfobulbaceae bacterium]
MDFSDADFDRLSTFLQSKLGIKLPESKRTMLSGRLTKRLRILGLTSFAAYCDFLFSAEGQKTELIPLMDTVTTNKTDFFREPAHFAYLTGTVLPSLISRGEKHCRVWSAGCSTGEEPYTLAMVLSDYRHSNSARGFSFEITASDISTKVLEIAKRAIYSEDKVHPIAMDMKKRYLLKGKGPNLGMVRIVPEQRALVRFGRLNFMHDDFRMPVRQQVIFCRNVLIYFDKETQEMVINRLCQYLVPDGYLFLGHSESIMGYKVPLIQEASTIFRRLA